MFLIYGSKITAASRGFPATARLSCLLMIWWLTWTGLSLSGSGCGSQLLCTATYFPDESGPIESTYVCRRRNYNWDEFSWNFDGIHIDTRRIRISLIFFKKFFLFHVSENMQICSLTSPKMIGQCQWHPLVWANPDDPVMSAATYSLLPTGALKVDRAQIKY